jgi:hypothetical protein
MGAGPHASQRSGAPQCVGLPPLFALRRDVVVDGASLIHSLCYLRRP